jgi:malate synthase
MVPRGRSKRSSLKLKISRHYFYLPKTESWQEVAWWREIFSFSEDRFDLPRGTIVLI